MEHNQEMLSNLLTARRKIERVLNCDGGGPIETNLTEAISLIHAVMQRINEPRPKPPPIEIQTTTEEAVPLRANIPRDHWVYTYKTKQCRDTFCSALAEAVEYDDYLYLNKCPYYHSGSMFLPDRIRTNAFDVITTDSYCREYVGHGGDTPWYDFTNPSNSCNKPHQAETKYATTSFKAVVCKWGDECFLRNWSSDLAREPVGSPCAYWHPEDVQVPKPESKT